MSGHICPRERAYPGLPLGWVCRFHFLVLYWVCLDGPRDLHQGPHTILFTLRRLLVKPFVSWACSRSRAPSAKQDTAVPSQTFRNDQKVYPLWTTFQVMIGIIK